MLDWSVLAPAVAGPLGGIVAALVTVRFQQAKVKSELAIQRARIENDARAAEQRLRTEFATETSVENAIRHLLEISELRYRTFPMIRHHIGGFEPNELRRLLVRSGAVRFMAADGTELWALIERVSDDFRYSRWKHKDTPLNQPTPSELFPGYFKDPSQY